MAGQRHAPLRGSGSVLDASESRFSRPATYVHH